jgi:branched-chain amino acid transport system permease protein
VVRDRHGLNLLGAIAAVSFGHAARRRAYTAGMLYSKFGLSAWWGFPASVVTVAVFALFIGYICLRLRGPFFALATLAVGVILRIVAENLTNFTGGDLGIMIRERTWIGKTWYYYIILAVAGGTFFLVKKTVASKLGYYFVAIREDQDAAESLGINTTLYKTVALVLSAVLTGFAGAVLHDYMGYIDPKVVFALDISIITIMVVMVGGVATQWGPITGAVIMVVLAEMIRNLPLLGTAHQSVFGVLLIVIIIFLPNGIVGDFAKLKRIAGFARRRS